MAWYDDYLQQGKGLVQRGQNWLTGNNLTSQDPNTVRAMNLQANNPFNPNAVISDSGGVHQGAGPVPFSDLSYQDMQGVHPQKFFPRDTSGMYAPNAGNIHQDPTRDWTQDIDINRLSTYPRPHRTNMADVSGRVGEYGQIPGQGNAEMFSQKKGFNFPNVGMLSLLKNLAGNFKDKFQYKGATETLWDPQTGQMISAEEQDKQNALGGYYSPAAKHARLQDKRVMKMLARQKAGKNFSETNLERLQKLGYGGPEEIIKPPVITAQGDQVNTGGQGQGGNQMGMSQMADRGRARGRGETGQIAGAHHFNQGGRAGYRFGEEVGQQTDLIEGPQGTNEFQETVVEGQEQPSREQLEALAFEIFQLPLEELDEQQLLVVYQEAMQGQPMEEAVQEEDVQFAAQGGLAGLL